MRHYDVILTYNDATDRRADDVRLFGIFFPMAGMGMCVIELSHMGKNNRNPDLVCEKSLSMTDAGDKLSNIHLDV